MTTVAPSAGVRCRRSPVAPLLLLPLYVVIDIYSRYVPGRMLARAENASLAKVLLAETIDKHGIEADRLTLHSDRGSPMTAKPFVFLMADLGVTSSYSRPHTSNDNPYSESHFRTVKYLPDFPRSFGSYEDAHAFCSRFFAWYCHDHRHSGIGYHTPTDVHFGRAEAIRDQRAVVLDRAYGRTLSASCASRPNLRRFLRSRGSTSRRRCHSWHSDSRRNLPHKG